MAYSQVKIAAVMADLALGVSSRKAAEKHKVSRPTVQKWAKQLPKLAQKKDLGEMVEEHLRGEISTLGTILGYCEDKAFVGEYGANIAVLYGVISDKAHAKLAALERSQREYQAQLGQDRQQPV